LRNRLRLTGLPYAGKEGVLNELLVIGRHCAQALENLIAVAKYKRGDGTLTAYQREYMRISRARLSKASKLEERLIGKKMTLLEKREFEVERQAQWMAERDAYIARHEGVAKVGHDDRLSRIAGFWRQKELQLDGQLAAAQAGSEELREAALPIRRNMRVISGTPGEETPMLAQAVKKLLSR
jgi:hypothetical protein